ncbi:MAG: O-antigen ligase family protein, partial [Gammaproteobacteria bacterium]|nr:O-antigen ligase family protein [Gammaproteobacteria bacterium]
LLTLKDRRHVLLFLVGLGLLVALVGLFSGDKISQRTNLAVAEFQEYFAGESYRTSVGFRLEVYKGAIKVIQENPLLGVGLGGEMQAIDALADRGEIRDLKVIKNVHNQFLQEGVAKGILGILSYLVLMGFLLIVFAKRMCASHNREVNTVGVMLVVGFLLFGLTNITFTHGIFNTFFVCMVALLLSVSGKGQK